MDAIHATPGMSLTKIVSVFFFNQVSFIDSWIQLRLNRNPSFCPQMVLEKKFEKERGGVEGEGLITSVAFVCLFVCLFGCILWSVAS